MHDACGEDRLVGADFKPALALLFVWFSSWIRPFIVSPPLWRIQAEQLDVAVGFF
jgi:hypothetical protein